MRSFLIAFLCGAAALGLAAQASAHGLAGKRFFPATLVVDDPFVSDELSLPTVSHIKIPADGDQPHMRITDVSGEFSKRITPNLGFSLGGDWLYLDKDGKQDHSGFGNLEVGLKYQFFKSEVHETILSAGIGMEIGGTGRALVGAENFDVYTPMLFFGKGMGDLPDSLAYLKPLAITGTVGGEIPSRRSSRKFRPGEDDGEIDIEKEYHPNVFTWGIAVEYSLPYLQSFVRDIGLPKPLSQLIAVVEVEFQHPLDRGQSGQFTGTVNPGIIWAGKYFQIAVEAILPVNDRTGKNVGIRGQIHFFLDDIFPTTIGRPIFGN
jgi:hypothetical protein